MRFGRIFAAIVILMVGLLGQMLLSTQQQILQVSPNSLSFEGLEGGPQPDPQYLMIANAGSGIMEWHASTDVDWIILGATEGQLSGGRAIQLLVLVEIQGLGAGTYEGTVTIEAPNAQGSPVQVAVTLTLTELPRLEVSPQSLSFTAQEGGADPGSQTLTIRNTGGQPLSWTASKDETWIILGQTQGELRAGGSQTVAVTVRITGLPSGTYNATIKVTAPGAQNSPVIVSVRLMIKPRPPFTVCDSGCPFTKIQPAIDAARSGDTITVGPGTYEENLTITKSLILKGIDLQQVILKSAIAGKAAMRITGSATVTVEGFTITGVKRPAEAKECGEAAGVAVEGQAKATFQNSRISGNTPCTGIGVAGDAQVSIQTSIVSGNRWGVVIFDHPNITIQNTEILNNEYIGIQVTGSTRSKTTIQNSKISGNGSGISAWSSTAEIKGNTINDNKSDGIALWSSSVTIIQGNIIKDNGGCGIYADSSANITSCSGNTVSGNKEGNYCGAAQGRCH